MAIHAYTSFSYSYLDRARVLAASLRRIHPDWILWAVLTDKEPEGFTIDWSKENFDHVVTAEDLFGPHVDAWLFKHDIVEACTAVKGKALQHIMDQKGADKVFYFDPDIALFNDMNEIVDDLDKHSIVLTPHQIDPISANDKRSILDNEITSLDYGVFNLGFVAVNGSGEARKFADWWADRLYDWCHDRLDIGVFVDQKWCNLVPCFFDDVKISRDPGYNVASWNLSHRTLTFDDDGTALINNVPLRFYHFTKLGPIGDIMTRRYAGDNTEVYELWWWYRQQVESYKVAGLPDKWWHYGVFEDGTKIPKNIRELYRDRKDLQARFTAPFQTSTDSFKEWLIKKGHM